MAIWRYAALKSSANSHTTCTFPRCYQAIAAAYICPLFFCILNYLYFTIRLRTKYLTQGPQPFDTIDGHDIEKLLIFKTTCQATGMDCAVRKVELYIVESSSLVKEFPVLHTIHFWTFSVLIKLIPCVVLTFFMGWMVNTLYKARKHHKMLEEKSAAALKPSNKECADTRNNSLVVPENKDLETEKTNGERRLTNEGTLSSAKSHLA